jgi:hypothetical protein
MDPQAAHPGLSEDAGPGERPLEFAAEAGAYAEVRRRWKAGDTVDLDLPMPVRLIESNPYVEETRSQVAWRAARWCTAWNRPTCPPGRGADVYGPGALAGRRSMSQAAERRHRTRWQRGPLPGTEWSTTLFRRGGPRKGSRADPPDPVLRLGESRALLVTV